MQGISYCGNAVTKGGQKIVVLWDVVCYIIIIVLEELGLSFFSVLN
jgi:hypothetical protein